MAKIKNPWKDGRDADVMDERCVGRPCLHVGEHKGTFVQGRGYTSYFKDPKLVCMHRHLHGCPQPIPDAEPERIRCCLNPDFPAKGKARKQRCRSCGAWAEGWVLEIRRGLPVLPHVECKHRDVLTEYDDLFRKSIVRCRNCGLRWYHVPKPMEPGRTFKEMLDEWSARIHAVLRGDNGE
jgi:ribosomal protein L37E